MDITTLAYFLFVLLTSIIYWSVRGRYQWIILLCFSILFFLINSKPTTILYILFSVLSVYIGTSMLERIDKHKRHIVAISVVLLNFLILGVLKYSNLVIDAVNLIGFKSGHSGEVLRRVNLVSPLAISFYTLQIVGYFIDCYRGKIKRETNIFKLLLFTCYFPMMISGPICRFDDIKHTLYGENKFDYVRVSDGMKRIALGVLKKFAIGNRVFSIVLVIDTNPEKYGGLYIWLSAIIYSVYLYMDFSGCMDIICGVSRILGVEIPENFKAPFFAKSTQEFWRRWHITLGAWLRDYVLDSVLKARGFINFTKLTIKKIGKKRGRKISVYVSMLSVWICMGIWHGNGWKYVLGEGLWYWFVIVLGMILETKLIKVRDFLHINSEMKLWHIFQAIRTFCIFSVGNLFFKAESLTSAINQIYASFSIRGMKMPISSLITNNKNISGWMNLSVLILSLVLVSFIDTVIYKEEDIFELIAKRKLVSRWCIYTLIIALIVLSLGTHSEPFAYAQF